jgi:hypothetical protein
MYRGIYSFTIITLIVGAAFSGQRISPLIVDHTYDFTVVTPAIVTSLVNKAPIIHYAHRSDGSAIPGGLEILFKRDSLNWPVSIKYFENSSTTQMPPVNKGLRMWCGMPMNNYTEPNLYWASASGRNELGKLLTNNPEIKYTSWTWCNEDDWWGVVGDIRGGGSLSSYFFYLDSLERAFPNVTFIYQTGAMRQPADGWQEMRQAEFNDSLRAWAKRQNKVLFDFADLDVWNNGQHYIKVATFQGQSKSVDFQHPAWRTPEKGWHANDSMALDKAKAWWTLMALLEKETLSTVVTNHYNTKLEHTPIRKSLSGTRAVIITNNNYSQSKMKYYTLHGAIVNPLKPLRSGMDKKTMGLMIGVEQ